MDLKSRLLDIKENLENDEKELVEAQAQLTVLTNQLKEKHNVSTVAAAKKLLKTMTQKEHDLETKIKNAIEDIEERYDV